MGRIYYTLKKTENDRINIQHRYVGLVLFLSFFVLILVLALVVLVVSVLVYSGSCYWVTSCHIHNLDLCLCHDFSLIFFGLVKFGCDFFVFVFEIINNSIHAGLQPARSWSVWGPLAPLLGPWCPFRGLWPQFGGLQPHFGGHRPPFKALSPVSGPLDFQKSWKITKIPKMSQNMQQKK